MITRKNRTASGASGQLLLAAAGVLLAGCASNLNRAITHQRTDEIEQFLAAGTGVNGRAGDSSTPLINAARYGDFALIKRLVERGAQVDARDEDWNSALVYLVAGPAYKNDAVAYLLDHGAPANERNREKLTPLLIAASRHCLPWDAEHQLELVTLLLKHGADANAATPAGELPLHRAAASGQPDKVLAQWLGVTRDPQALTSTGYSAFTEAARADQLAAARYLAAQGFKPQTISPLPPPPPAPPGQVVLPVVDPSLPIEAHAHDAYGDFLLAREEFVGALANYRVAQTAYEAAVGQHERAVEQYTLALQEERAARRDKWITLVAVDALGAGLGAATGVGFVAVPKNFKNRIDEFEDELKRDRSALVTLKPERSAIAAKIIATENQLKLHPQPVETPAKT